jgi:hypothetical protein
MALAPLHHSPRHAPLVSKTFFPQGSLGLTCVISM